MILSNALINQPLTSLQLSSPMNTLVPTISQPVYQHHPEPIHPVQVNPPRVVVPGLVAPSVIPIQNKIRYTNLETKHHVVQEN